MLMPLATGQLLHAFVFDRDCFPVVSNFIESGCLDVILTAVGLRQLHTKEYTQLRAAPPSILSSLSSMAVYQRDCRLPGRDVPSKLAV